MDVFFCEILENRELADKIFSITIKSGEIAHEAVAGQFLHIKCGDERILRRPISICDVGGDEVRFVFEVKGEGTRWLSQCNKGQKLNVLGPLGNGFSVPRNKASKENIVVVGGGIGTPPMLLAAKRARNVKSSDKSVSADADTSAGVSVEAILGFRSKSKIILADEFNEVCDSVVITTDDGSAGIHGTVTLPLEELIKKGNVGIVMSCGPFVMQKAVAELLSQFNIPHQVSLEERMGCGVGACLVCACATKYWVDGKALSKMSHVCKDGPVFDATAVLW